MTLTKLSILDAIERYKHIHSNFCNGSIDEAEAKASLEKLTQECQNSGLVFAPKVADLFEHAQFDTTLVDDESSDDYEDPEDYSSEY